jgi:hypothetical protein
LPSTVPQSFPHRFRARFCEQLSALAANVDAQLSALGDANAAAAQVACHSGRAQCVVLVAAPPRCIASP